MRGKVARAIRKACKYKVKNSRQRKLVPFATNVPSHLAKVEGLEKDGEQQYEMKYKHVLMHNDAARALYRETKRRYRKGEI